DFVAGVWVGYDDSLPLGWGEYGAVAALPAWIDFMKFAHEGRPRTQFPRPAGIVKVKVDPKTGLLPYIDQPDAIEEEFLADALPTETAPAPLPDAGVEEPGDQTGSLPLEATPDHDPDAPRPGHPTPSEAIDTPE